MNRVFVCLASTIVIAAELLCSPAIAQLYDKPRPLSTTGGNAARELRSIYASGIGTGYTGDSINRLSMNRARARVPQVGQSSLGGPMNAGLTTAAVKPFSNYSPLPTVSPYMNLFRDDFDGSSDFNYQTLVRPQIQQRELNERLQRQTQDNSRRLQALAAQSDFNIQGSQTQPPTGHPTTFMNYSHFYPQPTAPR